MNPDVSRLLELLSPAVLLNVKRGTKKPSAKKWEQISLEDMTCYYLSRLEENIGVSLGAASSGLHSIDCDEDAAFARLLELNPKFAETLHSHAKRGGNFWLRIEGEAPKSGHIHRNPKNPPSSRLGEWRSTGSQTIIHGKHPDGMDYRNNGKRPITIKFPDIIWPDDWWLPWQHHDEPSATSKEGQSARQAKDREVVETMLMSIPPRPDYELWLKISAAVRNSLGTDEQAIELLKAWSPEEKKGEYAELLSSSTFSQISFGTLMHHAAENGYAGAVKKFFYNTSRFGMQGRKGYVPLTGSDAVKEHLTKLGVPKNALGSVLCEIRETQYVDYIGPLGGHLPGVRTFNGGKIVVTSAPTLIEAREGEFPFLDKLIRGLFEDSQNPGQLPAFLNWLSHCLRAVLNHRRTQTPALALAGSKGDGKSLLIEVIKRALGGRYADGYDFFSGQKGFNGEMAGVELIKMDDVPASKDHRSRVRLAQSIKANQFAAGVRIEAKNRDPISLDPIQAIVIAVNFDPEELRVLPELTDSMEDKILLLKTSPAPFHDTQEENSAAIDAELPALIHFLKTRDLSDAYDGKTRRLKCFWHPEVVEAVGILSPERQLLGLALADSVVQNAIKDKGGWVGTAAQLEAALTDQLATCQHQARKLLSWGGACGAYLGRLADARNLGVTREGLTGTTRIQTYRIAMPEVGVNPEGKRGGEEVFGYFNGSKVPPNHVDKNNTGGMNTQTPSSPPHRRGAFSPLPDAWGLFGSTTMITHPEEFEDLPPPSRLPPDFDPETEASLEAAAEASFDRFSCCS